MYLTEPIGQEDSTFLSSVILQWIFLSVGQRFILSIFFLPVQKNSSIQILQVLLLFAIAITYDNSFLVTAGLDSRVSWCSILCWHQFSKILL